jgi:hypothetical protein
MTESGVFSRETSRNRPCSENLSAQRKKGSLHEGLACLLLAYPERERLLYPLATLPLLGRCEQPRVDPKWAALAGWQSMSSSERWPCDAVQELSGTM